MLVCFVDFDDLPGGGVGVFAVPDGTDFAVYFSAYHDGDGVTGLLFFCVAAAYDVGELFSAE